MPIETRKNNTTTTAVPTKRRSSKSSTVLGMKLKKSATALGVKIKKKKTADTTLFCRYELKYRITESQAAMVKNFIRPYLPVDRYSKLQPNGQYPISSLYLDSERLNLCRETLTGKKNRFKLRIRTYSDDTSVPRFFEIKRRINTVILKSRARVPDEAIAPLLAGKHPPLDMDSKDEKALRQFQLYTSTLHARPIVLVRYMREAFEGNSDNRVRVTFDRRIACQATDQPKVIIDGPGWHRLPLDFVVLEIKFTARYPAWLSRMVKALNLPQSAMSKYASSVKHACQLGFCAPEMTLF